VRQEGMCSWHHQNLTRHLPPVVHRVPPFASQFSNILTMLNVITKPDFAFQRVDKHTFI